MKFFLRISISLIVSSLLLSPTRATGAPKSPEPGTVLFETSFIGNKNAKEVEAIWMLNNVAKQLQAEGVFSGHYSLTEGGEGCLEIALKEPRPLSASFVGKPFPIKESEFIVGEVLVDAENISLGKELWHRAGVTVQFYDEKAAYVGHADIVRIAGTHSKLNFKETIIPPPRARSARLLFGLGGAQGTARLYKAKITAIPYESSLGPSPKGEICPRPWKMRPLHGEISGRTIFLDIPETQGSFRLSELYRLIIKNRLGSGVIKLPEDGPSSRGNGIKLALRLLSRGDKVDFPSLDPAERKLILNDLGHDGYFLIADRAKGVDGIIVGAFTEKGIFYGLQTLAQLIKRDGRGTIIIPGIVIIDRPALDLRGIATGKRSKEYMEKLAGLKINEIQVHGAPGIWKDWDSKIDLGLYKEVNDLGKCAQSLYIDASVAVWPGAYSKVFTWSDAGDKQIILEKLKLYRQAGFKKGLVVCASDYVRVGRGNGIVAPEDLARKMTLSEAHYGLLDYLQKHLAGNKFALEMFPFYYQGSRELHPVEIDYLRSLAKLPKTIEIIYGGRMSLADVNFISEVLGRKVLVRLPTPITPEEGSRRAPVSGVLASMFEKGVDQKIHGIVMETPADDSLLKEVADFLWNFGR
jgi:hypothetical protein